MALLEEVFQIVISSEEMRLMFSDEETSVDFSTVSGYISSSTVVILARITKESFIKLINDLVEMTQRFMALGKVALCSASYAKRAEMIFFDAQSHFQLSSFLQLVSGLDAFTTPVEPLQNGTSHAISTWISLNVFGFSKWTNFFNVDQLADLERCWRMNSCYCGNDPGCLSNCPRKKVMTLRMDQVRHFHM